MDQMKTPTAYYDDDYSQLRPVAPERRLYLAVFAAAFDDLVRGCEQKHIDAMQWFKGERKEELISYNECQELFSLGTERVSFIKACVEDSNALYRVTGRKKFRSIGNRRK